MTDPNQHDHWLVRPNTIRWLWIGFYIVLAATVLAQFFIKVKGYFVVDGWLGFGAFFGFFACLAMVYFAKYLGKWLKKDENYYSSKEQSDV